MLKHGKKKTIKPVVLSKPPVRKPKPPTTEAPIASKQPTLPPSPVAKPKAAAPEVEQDSDDEK